MKVRLLIIVSFLFVSALYGQILPEYNFQQVNTTYDELNPVIAPDGQTLFFTVANHPSNIGGRRDPGDIWFSTFSGGSWSAPAHAGHAINDRAYNAVAGISTDGSKLYLLSHYAPEGGTPKTQGISVASRTEGGWSRPKNISIPYFHNKSTFLTGALSEELGVFIFSAETYGTHGVDDLYVSLNENGKWTEPKNLGLALNTQFQELTPSLSADGKTLFFSSNGRKGQGSFDIYSTSRLDDTWVNWSPPLNMGSLNSEGRELFFRDYPALGISLMTSTINSDGYGDVRFQRYAEPPVVPNDTLITLNVPEPDTIFATTEAIPVIREEKKVSLKVYGKVTNAKTGEPVAATLSFAGPQGNLTTTAASGGYDIDVSRDQNYTVKIEAPGFISTLEKLDILSYETQELEMNFSVQPVEVGTTVNLKSVLFLQTKAELMPGSTDELDLVVSFLKANPTVKIELAGHTDNRGVHADNVRLSQQRVNTVKKYLVEKGIDGKRISGKGYGGTKPIASNDSEETRMMNRRVEFIIRKF